MARTRGRKPSDSAERAGGRSLAAKRRKRAAGWARRTVTYSPEALRLLERVRLLWAVTNPKERSPAMLAAAYAALEGVLSRRAKAAGHDPARLMEAAERSRPAKLAACGKAPQMPDLHTAPRVERPG